MPHPSPFRCRVPLFAATTVALAGLVLTGCVDSAPEAAPRASASQVSRDEFLSAHDLAELDAAQVIERLDTMPVAERPTDLLASVEPDTLVLTDQQNRETRLPMPEDRVYVSVAPYQQQTHECHFHSLTTCLGELGNEDVRAKLTEADGTVLVDETRETYDNGFVGFWVPRDTEATLTIEHDGKTGTVPVSTVNEDDATCLTTLRLT